MGEFPAGEAPGAEPGGDIADAGAGGTDGSDPDAQAGGGAEPGGAGPASGAGPGEPGFEVTVGSDGLPSMVDIEPVIGGVPGMGDIVGTILGEGSQGSGQPGSGPQGSGPGLPGQQGSAGPGNGQTPGDTAEGGMGGGAYPGSPAGTGSFPGGQGPLTPGEQVAILDAELERGMGDFDAMILEEQAAQRRSARENSEAEPVQTASAAGAGEGESSGEGGYGREMGGGGNSGGGGGMGGIGGGGSMPQNTAKYPPPADIPSGNDDDVVARQLREAAMREADPAVREKLWVEYRKYKGIKAP